MFNIFFIRIGSFRDLAFTKICKWRRDQLFKQPESRWMARLPKGWGAAFNLINPHLRHVLKGMISSTWPPQLSVLYFPCCDTHLCVSNSFQRLSAILGKREKEACSQVDILTDLPHSTTSSSSAAVAGAEQFPYPISFDFLPSSSCHGCDCDAIPTRPYLGCC